MTSNLSWGYAHYGKKDGFELFEVEGLLGEINNSSKREDLHNALQLKLEEIRIFEGDLLYRLSQFESEEGTINLFTVFSYALDEYQRDGFLATTLALSEGSPEVQKLWDFIHLFPNHIGNGSEILKHYFPASSGEENIHKLPNNGAFIPLYSSKPNEAMKVIEHWLAGDLNSYGTLYFTANKWVIESIRSNSVKVFDENPFWEKPEKELVEIKNERLVTSKNRKSQNKKAAPANSLVHAFEDDQSNRWGKQTESKETKGNKGESRIWGWLTLGFIGILGSLLWIAL
ncbi:MAG: hypothetical protein MRZ79_00115 [Bacteroidia bacterium]|nr:hypothetical protein [Bacteroidia bacterium]